ncbi:MAG: uracil-DNA glycosylase family protein [Rhodospirillales bacterium]|nr:uracil-DNA glycosylase family protein [Alphaproteobacteria bacterium]MBL6948442.1 uracil-DNA glycosylase family protein [Rhodospirillales bacterium]
MPGMDKLLAEIEACRLCADNLPLGPRPVLRVSATAKLLIVGQAPGTRVHETGIPWNDASGDRLRDWLDLAPEIFYDESRVAIMPIGFCYPGRDPKGGDNPPRPECAPTWHSRILSFIPDKKLTLLVGSYAQRHYLGSKAGKTMTETVKGWRHYLPEAFPLPHPSWRTTGWQRKNPWFDDEVLPELQKCLGKIIKS